MAGKILLHDIIKELNLINSSECIKEEQLINGGYCCDLLSNVMGKCREDYLWITIQTHQNIIGIASLLNLGGIIIAEGFKPDEDTLKSAKREDIPLLLSEESGFEICGKLYDMGLRGSLIEE